MKYVKIITVSVINNQKTEVDLFIVGAWGFGLSGDRMTVILDKSNSDHALLDVGDVKPFEIHVDDSIYQVAEFKYTELIEPKDYTMWQMKVKKIYTASVI